MKTHQRSTPRRLLPSLLALALCASSAPCLDDDEQEILQFLDNTGVVPAAKAKARYRVDGGEQDFKVELEQIAAGDYELWVGDAFRGTLTVTGLGEGELEYEIPLDPPKPLLDFPVLDQTIEIRVAGEVLFSDVFAGDTGGGGGGGGGGTPGGGGAKTKIEVFLTPTGVDLDATGRARYEEKPGVLRFDVEVEKLDPADYDLLVGGLVVASFTTVDSTEFEVEFRDPPEPGHLPLTFDPLGQTVEVLRGDDIVLAGQMPGDPSSTGTTPPKSGRKSSRDLGRKKSDALSVDLQPTGAVAGVDGTVELRQETDGSRLSVEAEDLPPGIAEVLVDHAIVNTTAVDGFGRVDLTFAEFPEAGQLLLDFAVKGRLIELRVGGTVLLAVVFPLSVQSARDLYVAEFEKPSKQRRNLANAGSDLDARGHATRIVKADRTLLRVRARDLPIGTHELFVGDLFVSEVLVTKEGATTKLILSTAPQAKQILLPVDAVGQTVEVRAGDGEVLLVAAMP